MSKIAWILESGSLSGGVKVAFEMACGLAARGHEIVIVSLDLRPKWFDWKTHAKVEWLQYGSYPGMVESAKGLALDGIVATWWKTAYVAAEVVAATHIRGLYLVQDIETSYYFDPIQRQAVEESYALGLRHFTTSRWVEKNLGAEYVGIAIGRWRESPPKGGRKREILACVRRQALKGWRELLEVVRRTNKHSIPFVTFGMDRELKLHDYHTHVTKPSDRDVKKMYSGCGVFVSTSQHEGFSMTILEAMSCGAPVVMLPCDGPDEYVKNGENCLVADNPKDMAEKIVVVLNDRELRGKLGKAGVETARRYESWSEPLERLAALF